MRVGYYADTVSDSRSFTPLAGKHDADTVIIGGGFAGLNTAMSLLERGDKNVTLLEAEQIGFGASGRNGGFVFGGYSLGEQELLAKLGSERARALYQRSVDAVSTVRERVANYAIDCDLVDAGVLWVNWFRDPQKLRVRQQLLATEFGTHWEWVPQAELRTRLHTDRYSDALFEHNALHLQPLSYAIGLARAAVGQGVAVHENSRVTDIRRQGAGWIVRTKAGEINAQRVVLACGGYLAGLSPQIDRAVLPIATYVVVTEPLHDRLADCMATKAAVYDTRFAFDYYRALPDTRLLWGGRISVRRAAPATIKRLLCRDIARVYPQLADVRIDYAWSGLMSYARHQMPQIGTNGEGLWWAQAFGGHGLAPTTVAGEVVAAAIAEDDPGWREFAAFGLERTYRPFGYLAAQASYWRLQIADRLKELLEA